MLDHNKGYWFWQEFIAEAISKRVSYKLRSAKPTYHPEQIDWLPQVWKGIVDKLRILLEDTFTYYPSTIDEYSLAHYFANLLVDDFIILFRIAAKEGNLKTHATGKAAFTEEEIEPTCISEVDRRYQPSLWKLMGLLDGQMQKEHFWEITEDFLLDIGTCIGDLMLAKILVMAESIGAGLKRDINTAED